MVVILPALAGAPAPLPPTSTPPSPPGARWSARQETLGVERHLLAPQVIHRPAHLRFQHRQRFLLAALLLLPGQPRLRRQAAPQHQAGGFREGPLQMGVADLLAAGALTSCRPIRAAQRTSRAVRQEVADLGEAADAGRSRRAGPGSGSCRCRGWSAAAQTSPDRRSWRVLDQVPFELVDLRVVGVDQGQVGGDAELRRWDRRSGRRGRRCGCRRSESFLVKRRQVVLAVGVAGCGRSVAPVGGRRSCGGAAGRGSARLARG